MSTTRPPCAAAIAGNRAFVGSSDGRIYGLDLASGKVVWEHEDGGALTSSPALASGRIVIGSTVTPNSLAMIDAVSESGTPMISMAASARIVEPMDDKRRWVFKTPQNDIMMSLAIATHMANSGVKRVAFIGFADAYGEGWYNEFSKAAGLKRIEIVANERYARSDTSVTGQVLKLVAAKPDAILIAGSGTPAALPQKALKERGYAGKIYQTHGIANNDFLRVCGKDCEGTVLPTGPVLVRMHQANMLADSLGDVTAGEFYGGEARNRGHRPRRAASAAVRYRGRRPLLASGARSRGTHRSGCAARCRAPCRPAGRRSPWWFLPCVTGSVRRRCRP